MLRVLIAIVVFFVGATNATADDFTSEMRGFYEDQVAGWAASPILVSAIKAQNEKTADFDQAKIDELDAFWGSHMHGYTAPFITAALSNGAAEFLRRQVAASDFAITEAFVMDARGLTAATAQVTSNYWYGDKASFEQTVGAQTTEIHIGDIEIGAATKIAQGQISAAIIDPETNEIIGVLTVGVDLVTLVGIMNADVPS